MADAYVPRVPTVGWCWHTLRDLGRLEGLRYSDRAGMIARLREFGYDVR